MTAPTGGEKTHYERPGDLNKTLCGRVIARYSNLGTLLAMLKTEKNPRKLTCIMCKSHPSLDGVLGHRTHTGYERS